MGEIIDINPDVQHLPVESKKKIAFRAQKLKEAGFSQEELRQWIDEDVRTEIGYWMDSRNYLRVFNRRYAEDRLRFHMKEIFESEDFETGGDLCVIILDINGLKSINDLSGHQNGNRLLSLVGELIKKGNTVEWLKKQKSEVISFAMAGDEFGFVLKTPFSLKEACPDYPGKTWEAVIQEMLSQELLEVDAKDLVDMSNPRVIDLVSNFGLPADFTFRITVGCGSASFLTIMEDIKTQPGEDYDTAIGRVIGKMFYVADTGMYKDKEKKKASMEISDPSLSMFLKRSAGEREQYKQILALKKEIEQLRGF